MAETSGAETTETLNLPERMRQIEERHEALTQTVEHLALQGEEQNKRIGELLNGIVEQNKRIERLVGIVENLTHIVIATRRRPWSTGGRGSQN